ncbi:MAG TPA: LUD domain-containing protein [Chitinophagaceae bacterium]|nr:LUD domain-containing protein [Chitinophagaceae bacterium]
MPASREIILSRIRKALKENPVEMPFPEAEKKNDIFPAAAAPPEELFAAAFNALGGRFVYCTGPLELCQQLEVLSDNLNWKKIHCRDRALLELFKNHELDIVQEAGDMNDIEVGISLCEFAIARTGSLLVSAAQDSGRALPVYAPVHIAVVYSRQLVYDIADAISGMKEKYGDQLPSMMALTTGPSRTADIEKTLVVGVHGPKEVYVFLVDEP